jgi:hypothetical protein
MRGVTGFSESEEEKQHPESLMGNMRGVIGCFVQRKVAACERVDVSEVSSSKEFLTQ